MLCKKYAGAIGEAKQTGAHEWRSNESYLRHLDNDKDAIHYAITYTSWMQLTR
jgi:hypothetical protein